MEGLWRAGPRDASVVPLSQGNPVLPGDPEVLAALGGRMIRQCTQKACSELRGEARVAP